MPVRGFDPKIQYLKIQNKNLNRTILNQLIIERSGGRKMISLLKVDSLPVFSPDPKRQRISISVARS
jgi:hypothetical protein